MAKSSLPQKSKKTRYRATRFTLADDRIVAARAKASGKSFSAYMREKSLS